MMACGMVHNIAPGDFIMVLTQIFCRFLAAYACGVSGARVPDGE